MRRAAIAAVAAAGLVLVHAVPAQAGGSQQEAVCVNHVRPPRRRPGNSRHGADDPTRATLRALHRKMSAAAPPYIARMNRFVGRSYPFRNYTGTVTNLSDGNPARGPVGIDLLVALELRAIPGGGLHAVSADRRSVHAAGPPGPRGKPPGAVQAGALSACAGAAGSSLAALSFPTRNPKLARACSSGTSPSVVRLG